MLRALMSDGAVELQPLAETHREPLRRACAEDAEIWSIYPESWIGDHFDASFDACLGVPNTSAFAIVDLSGVVGMSSYLNVDQTNRTLEIGRTYLAPRVRGTGLNAHVKKLMMDRAFGEGFTRIEFRIDTRNTRSIAAVEKLGAVKEGVLRRNRITWTGHVRDTAIYSILVDKWHPRRLIGR